MCRPDTKRPMYSYRFRYIRETGSNFNAPVFRKDDHSV